MPFHLNADRCRPRRPAASAVAALAVLLAAWAGLASSAQAASRHARVHIKKTDRIRAITGPLDVVALPRIKPKKVAFYVDGRRRNTARKPPFRLGGRSGKLQTANLKVGRHRVTAVAAFAHGRVARASTIIRISMRRVPAASAAPGTPVPASTPSDAPVPTVVTKVMTTKLPVQDSRSMLVASPAPAAAPAPAAPAPPPPLPPVPRPPAEQVADFESGNLGQYGAAQTFAPNGATLQSQFTRAGGWALHSRVDGATASDGSTRRSHFHLNAMTQAQGATKWFANSVMIPSGIGSINGWWCVMEWFGEPWTGSPPIALHAGNGVWAIQANPGAFVSLAILPRLPNVWYDFLWQIRFSRGGDGFVRVWAAQKDQPLQQIVNWNGQTMHGDMSSIHPMLNSYASANNGLPLDVYHDEVRLGSSMESVLPPGR
jgi:hypothetical protein